jgi:hypothetical protein
MAIIRNLAGTMSSISALQGTCNTQEKKLFAKLTKLEAVLDAGGKKVTEATFKEFDGDIAELGKALITEGGTHSASIKEVRKDVSISRS